MKCLYCGKEFKPKKMSQRYCSLLCRNKGIKSNNGITKICLTCGRNFYVCKSQENRKFCSVDCRNNLSPTLIYYKCKKCGKNISISTKQPYRVPENCKSCIAIISKKRHKKSSHYNNRRLTLKIGHCEKCGYEKHPEILGVHHKDHNHCNNIFKNLIVLCPNCHSIEHSKHIPHGRHREQLFISPHCHTVKKGDLF